MSQEADRIPVVVGVGDVVSGSAGAAADPVEPMELVLRAVRAALDDSGTSALGAAVDAIHAVRTTSWNYDDLPALIAARLGASAPTRSTSTIGGHHPARLMDRVGHDIAAGRSSVALVVGGETQASVRALTKAGTDPVELGWAVAPGGPPTFAPDDLGSAEMQRAGILAPVQIYPLFDRARADRLGLRPSESLTASAELYSRFSAVAARHPVAWSPVERSPDDIAGVDASNRAVSDCYPLAMNAMPFVDQAAAVLVCSLAAARAAGVDEDRIVYLWGGAGASDAPDIMARSTFDHSPALRAAVRTTLAAAGVAGADLTFVDAYSCFPVVPLLLMDELGLSSDATPTVLGGHSFFGGPLSSYSLHAVAESTRLLRQSRGGRAPAIAMVHANGGYLTHQHTILLSTDPHEAGYVGNPDAVSVSATAVPVTHGHSGRAIVETATVMFGRGGEPEQALVIARTPEGDRIAGRTGADAAAALHRVVTDRDVSPVGLTIDVVDEGGNLDITLDSITANGRGVRA
ncbi:MULTISPECIES: thiolase C-terminal domain-containing protein [unclassified Rhodococcus (in: high G+C Gram-positive bacteria)]|uniref:thiolase C-terminal domain-containing protein n=1 Tax=unclassified Rhodococcus (in: high G+C Gram-positive bacteria) TaxID=192944 RepID=UPI0006FB6A50|nr:MULTISPECIES: hypothetical protein [unclassified Rhodococcus (in: high G+C Gram-positive bacteria)]KQU27991.1 acetyl-CoA acetyltransferase [Rhodococcus sp. Leaf225]KQU46102.1 acetyl-CoA acetyltransferase [Rhodococcus sp. Leaf258]